MVISYGYGQWCKCEEESTNDEGGENGAGVHAIPGQDAVAGRRAAKRGMDANHSSLRDSPSQIPASHLKYHLPYFTPTEIEQLSERQRGKLSLSQEERARQQACGYIEAVSTKIGLYAPFCLNLLDSY